MTSIPAPAAEAAPAKIKDEKLISAHAHYAQAVI